jgi:hypothetical protein
MVAVIFTILIGLFVWLALPSLIVSGLKSKKTYIRYYVHLSCKIVGIAIVAFSTLRLILLILFPR